MQRSMANLPKAMNPCHDAMALNLCHAIFASNEHLFSMNKTFYQFCAQCPGEK